MNCTHCGTAQHQPLPPHCHLCGEPTPKSATPQQAALSSVQTLTKRGLYRVWQGKYGQGQPDYQAVAEKTAGAFPGAIYEKAKTNPAPTNPERKRWLGKVGSYDNQDKGDTLNSASAARRGHGRDAIKEKIAADCYIALAYFTGEAFIVPKYRLAHLPIINEYNKNNARAQAIHEEVTRQGKHADRQIHIMSKLVTGYKDINTAIVINRQGHRKPFMMHLQNDAILSNTVIHNNKPIPLRGLVELFAIGRLLMDIDILGDSGANTGYIIQETQEGQCYAQIVKVDPGFAFSFYNEQNLLHNLLFPAQNPRQRSKQRRLAEAKDIQLGANGLTLRWQQLDPAQQTRFLYTLMRGIPLLQDKTLLAYLIDRNGEFNRGAGEAQALLKPELIEDYCASIEDNLTEQQKIYRPLCQTLQQRGILGGFESPIDGGNRLAALPANALERLQQLLPISADAALRTTQQSLRHYTDIPSLFQMGQAHANAGRESQARQCFQRCADQGYAPAKQRLAAMGAAPSPVQKSQSFDLPEIDIPHEYLCPITHELMKDPVILLDDHETYDREAIENYLRNTPNSKSPLTGKPLVRKQVIPNKLLKQTIDKFRDKHTELNAPDRITPSTDESVAVDINKDQNEIEQEKQRRRAPFFHYQEHLKAYLQQRGILNQHQGEQNYDVFISYPWEDQDKRNLVAHRKLQAFLDRLCKDLKIIGLKVFLDIYDMARDMRQVMERSIEQSGIILTICKPFLKQTVDTKPNGNIALEINCTLKRAQQNPKNVLPLLLEDSWETALPTPMQQQLDPRQTGQDIRKTYADFSPDKLLIGEYQLFSEEYQRWFVTRLIPRVLNNLGLPPLHNDPWLFTLTTWYYQQEPQRHYAPGKNLAIEQIPQNDQYQRHFPNDDENQRTEKQQQAFNFFLHRLKELNGYRQAQQPRTHGQQLSVLLVYPPLPADATGIPLPEHAEQFQWLSQFSEHLQRAGINPDYWTGETDLPANAPNAVITVCSPPLKQTVESALTPVKSSSYTSWLWSSKQPPKNPWQQLQEHRTKPEVTDYPLIYQGTYETAIPNWTSASASPTPKNFLARNTESKSLAFNQIYYYNLMAGIIPKGLLRDLLNYPDNDNCYNFLYTNYQQMYGGWGLTDLLAAEARRQTQASLKTYTKPPLSQRQIPEPIPPRPINPAQLQQLLNHVARGEEEEAEALLQKTAQQPENYSALTLGYGTVTDYSERTFEGISALQYALWAKDVFMWRMLIRYMPKGAIRDQVTEWADPTSRKTQGWRRQHGDSYDFQPLIDAYKTLEANWSPWTSEQITDYFIKTIGELQRQVPAHVAQEYAHQTRSFYPTPDFASQTTLPRKAKINEDKNNEGTSFWYSGKYNGGVIGKKWGGYRGSRTSNARGGSSSLSYAVVSGVPQCDRSAVQSMSATRAQQLNELVKTVTKK